MMTRDEQLAWLRTKVANNNLVKHMLATEAAMGALAEKFGEDPAVWRAAGLLHDIDLETVGKDMAVHGNAGADWLESRGFSRGIVNAVRSHPGHVPPETRMAMALRSVDPLTGLIVSAALINPAKKIADIDAAFVLKRFREKRFAAGASREEIARCADFGLSLEEFVGITLGAMQGVAGEIGL